MSLRLIFRLLLVTCIIAVVSQPAHAQRRWEFNTTDGGWSGYPATSWDSNGGFIVLGAGTDPRIASSSFHDAAGIYNYCKFIAANLSATTNGEMFVRYYGEANFNGLHSTTFNFPHRNIDEHWACIVVRLDGISGWSTGEFAQIRIDPASMTTANVYFDKVVLAYDANAPTISSFTSSPSGWTNVNNYTMSVTAADPPATGSYTGEWFGSGVNRIEMRSATGSWQTVWSYVNGELPDPVTATKSGALAYQQGSNTYYVQVTDNVGRVRSSSLTYYYDSQAPNPTSPSVSPSGWSASSSFTFTWSKPSDVGSGVQSYQWRIDGGSVSSTTATSITRTISSGCHTFEVRAVDAAGNTSDWRSVQACYDANNPGTPSPTSNPSGWSSTNSFQLCWNPITDVGSGLSHYEWRVDGGGVTSTTSTCVTRTTTEGSHTFEVRAVDNVGRMSSFGPATFRYDPTPPGKPIPTADPPGWSASSSRTVTWPDPGDATSGIARYWWRVDGGTETSTTSRTISIPLTEGCHNIEVKAEDNAGNQSGWGGDSACYDGTNPAMALVGVNGHVISSPGQAFALADDTITFCGTASDAGSGLAAVEAAGDGNSYACTPTGWANMVPADPENWCWQITGLSGMNRFYFRAADSVGHVTDSLSNWVELCIDRNAPISASRITGTGHSGYYILPAQLVMSAHDSTSGGCAPCGSGVQAIYYRLNGSNLSIYESPVEITQAGPNQASVYAVDSLGNAESPKILIFTALKLGDVNYDLLVNSADIIYLVNYIFKSGPAPQPILEVADVNCDGKITSADIISLINYVFKGMQLPCWLI